MRRLIVSLVILATAIPAMASAGVIGKPSNNLGLVAYWPMTEGAGSSLGDVSGNRRNATILGGSGSTWVSGRGGQILNFEGSRYASTTRPGGELGSNSITECAWVNINSFNDGIFGNGNGAVIFSTRLNDADKSPTLVVSDKGDAYTFTQQKLIFTFDTTGHTTGAAGTTTIQTGRWYFMCGVFENTGGDGTWSVYVDGVKDNETDTNFNINGGSNTLPFTDTEFMIGQHPAWVRKFNGRIYDMRIYRRALSGAEIASLYKYGSSRTLATPALARGNVSQGLVGHWTFDQKDITTNAILDVSGYGNNGGFFGGATSSTKAAGKLAQGFKFSDPSHQIRIPNDADLSPPTAGTVSAWVKDRITRTGGWQVFVSKYNCITDRDGYALVKQPDNTFMLYLGTTTEAQGIGSNSSYTDRGWHHVLGTWNGTTGSLYVDGVLASAPQPMTWSPRTNIMDLTIGSCDSGYEYDGTVDDVRVYNRALSAAEAKQVYLQGSQTINSSSQNLTNGTSLTSGLVGHWTFDNLDVTDKVYDKSAVGNHGYFYGGSTSSAKVAGKIGQALRFDGVDDRIRFANGTYGLGTVHTAAVWVDFEDSGDGVVLGQAAGEYQLYIDQTDLYYNATDNFVNVPHGGLDGWHHISIVRNGTSVTFYKDGVQLSTPQTLGANTAIDIASIGAHSLGAFPTQGKIDDVRLYNRALSVAEVKQLYNLGK